MKHFSQLIFYVLLLILVSGVIYSAGSESTTIFTTAPPSTQAFSLQDIPAYCGEGYITVNRNHPFFTDEELVTTPFETYSELDSLGRCGVAYANICQELMPTEKRGSIGQIKPSGWHTVKYPDIIPDLFLYNRCHLIAHQLANENANPCNLITGTRYMNAEIMVLFEQQVADYVSSTGNHVLYRVTPVFEDDNLVATGILMEAKSVEDRGAGVCFNVFLYNVQPGITIDYATGDSFVTPRPQTIPPETIPQETSISREFASAAPGTTYVINTNTKKFHIPTCNSVDSIAEHNRQDVTENREEIITNGYIPCKRCNP